jgi:hypothetical protein
MDKPAGPVFDANGFLASATAGASDVVDELKSIKGDTTAMLGIMSGRGVSAATTAVRNAGNAAANAARYGNGATPVLQRMRVRNESTAVRAATDMAAAVRNIATVQAASQRRSVAAMLRARSADGRFLSTGGASAASGAAGLLRTPDGRFGSGGKAGGRLSAGFGAAMHGASGAIAGSERIDPMIEALSEARGAASMAGRVASPVGRTLMALARRRSVTEKEQRQAAKEQTKQIKALRKESAAGNKSLLARLRGRMGGGGSSFGLLGMLPGLLGAGGGLLGKIGGMAAGGIGALLTGGKGLLSGAAAVGKRLPLIGNIISLIEGFGKDFAIDNDASMTAEEKRSAKIANVGGVSGGLIGTTLGAIAGTAFLPMLGPLGTVIGATIGGWLGSEGGQIIAEPLVNAGTWLKDQFTDAVKVIKDAFEPARQLFEDIGRWLQTLPGFGILATPAKAAARAALDAGQRAVEVTKGAASTATSFVSEKVSERWEKLKGNLGAVSAFFESGGKASATSTGKGDFGGASYGMHQLSSKKGTLQSFLSQSGYASQFSGLTPGTPEFNAKWEAVTSADPAFAGSQKSFIKATHYDPQMQRLKNAGIDLSGRSDAVKEAVWSTATQFGPQSSLITSALAGKDVSGMTDAGIITAIQDYKAANNSTLFRSSSAAVQAGTLARAGQEKQVLLSHLGVGQAPTAAPSIPGAPSMPSLPRMAAVAIPPAPPESSMTRLNSPAPAAPRNAPALPGQDVSDRTIAHIVTGGISGAIAHR